MIGSSGHLGVLSQERERADVRNGRAFSFAQGTRSLSGGSGGIGSRKMRVVVEGEAHRRREKNEKHGEPTIGARQSDRESRCRPMFSSRHPAPATATIVQKYDSHAVLLCAGHVPGGVGGGGFSQNQLVKGESGSVGGAGCSFCFGGYI